MGKEGCRAGESESRSLFQTALLARRVEGDLFRAVSPLAVSAAVILWKGSQKTSAH